MPVTRQFVNNAVYSCFNSKIISLILDAFVLTSEHVLLAGLPVETFVPSTHPCIAQVSSVLLIIEFLFYLTLVWTVYGMH